MKSDGNIQEITGNKAVAAGNRIKAISDFVYHNDRVKACFGYLICLGLKKNSS